MALAPAYWMSMQETNPERRPLAVMKVLMRNSSQLYARGGVKAEVLFPVKPGKLADDKLRGEQLLRGHSQGGYGRLGGYLCCHLRRQQTR